jgi:sugar lactone lactonase YvrE
MTYPASYFGLDNIVVPLTYTPPLNTVGSSVAAYSVRKLRSAYTGLCMKIQRSSDNSQMDIGFGVNGLVNSSQILSFTGSGDALVVTWYDQSGNSRNLANYYGTSEAYIVRAGVLQTVNGLPTLNFNSGRTASLFATWYTSNYTTGYTFLNVANCSDYLNNFLSNKVNTSDIGCSSSLYVNNPNPFYTGNLQMYGGNGANGGTPIFVKNPMGLRDGEMYYPGTALPTSTGGIIYGDSGTRRLQKVSSSNVFEWKSGYGGVGNGQFDTFSRMTYDNSGNILTTESTPNGRVQKFTSAGVYISQFGSVGTANGQFNSPTGIRVDASGNIFVADHYNHRVQKFDSNGTYLAQIGVTSVIGTDNAHFRYPMDIAFDSSGNIFILDYGNHRVQKFNSSLVYVSTLNGTLVEGNGNGQFNYPTAIEIDSSNNIWVGDQGTYKLKKYNSSYTWLANYGTYGAGNTNLYYVSSIRFDFSGNLIIADAYNLRVLKWSNTGTFIYKWESNPIAQPLSVWTYKGLYSTKLMNAYLNGVDNGSGISALLADGAGTPLCIGGLENSEGQTGYRGNISEFITYGTALSDTNRGIVEANEKSYFGTP